MITIMQLEYEALTMAPSSGSGGRGQLAHVLVPDADENDTLETCTALDGESPTKVTAPLVALLSSDRSRALVTNAAQPVIALPWAGP